MTNRFLRFFVCLCMGALTPLYADAYNMVVVKNEAPIRIDQAVGYSRGNKSYECVSFTNLSAKVVTSVRFRFIYIDGKGEQVGGDTFDRKGSFDPHGSVSNLNVTVNTRMPWYEQDLSRYPNCQSYRFPTQGIAVNVVGVERVEFEDGTSWTVTPKSPLPQTSPVPTTPTP